MTSAVKTAFLPAALATLSLLMSPIPALAESAWSRLPSLPDAEGFAGSFVGVSGETLLVAGGTNFPDKRPWEGGTKIWYDTVFALETPDGSWRKAGHLPKANGYGVSLSVPQGLLCVGGGNLAENFRDVFVLRYENGQTASHPLPPLPRPCAFMAGVEMNGTVYVAGGIETPSATEALKTFWALDLKTPDQGWRELPPCPGRARILATMATHNGSVYLISGAALKAGVNGKAEREWLDDVWSFTPEKGWQKRAAMPRVAVAAPSPAPVVDGRILVMGGDDGKLVNFEPKDRHPGFPRDVWSYSPADDRWTAAGSLPFSLVTTPALNWKGRIVIAGGEARPGKRSPEVWATPLPKPN